MFRRAAQISDYCILDSEPEHRLSQFERLTLTGGDELSKALDWVSKQINSVKLIKPQDSLDLQVLKASLESYFASQDLKRPYAEVSSTPLVTEHPVHGLPDGEVVDLIFESPYQAKRACLDSYLDSLAENKHCRVRLWRHAAPAKATMVALHGWTMGDQRLNSLAFLPGLFYRAGLDVALVELPLHGRRKGRGAGADPSMLLAGNPCLVNEVMEQVILELRGLRAYLESCGSREIGCIGMSLGGYCAALWAALDELSFCVPIVPLSSMSELAWKVLSRKFGPQRLRQAGFCAKKLRDLFSRHNPTNYRAATARERMLFIGGKGDKIVSARHPRRLAKHWDGARVVWLEGGHAALTQSLKALEKAIDFLIERGVVSESARELLKT
ncbi:MAG: hypothetical protein DCC75_03560 [Proteobacteria bacterium]|nr:MAG: hypothetical protein DCC75_03560 [Pseudomonadota bacterium]